LIVKEAEEGDIIKEVVTWWFYLIWG
jgi:hypothetical protein